MTANVLPLLLGRFLFHIMLYLMGAHMFLPSVRRAPSLCHWLSSYWPR